VAIPALHASVRRALRQAWETRQRGEGGEADPYLATAWRATPQGSGGILAETDRAGASVHFN
jgi:hypothetical protein